MIAIDDILVPTDFSEPADAALAYAKSMADQFGGRVHLLHVVATPQIGWAADGSTISWPDFLSGLETDARARLDRLVPSVGEPLADRFMVATAVGVPVEQILQYATVNHIDLIVMGTHGRGLVGHMFLGSVAERVVRRASMPVLTVHGAPAHPAGVIKAAVRAGAGASR